MRTRGYRTLRRGIPPRLRATIGAAPGARHRLWTKRHTFVTGAWHRDNVPIRQLLLEVAAQGLLALDCLEQRLEVPVSEAARAMALDHFEEERRPVLRRLR